MVEAMLGFVWMLLKVLIVASTLYKFLAGDKEKMETLWYGMSTLIFVIACK